MYGSAAVVGYMMCAIFWIRDADNLYAAKMLAYSMQYINFIRDVDEDTSLWRKYLFNHAFWYDNIIHDDQNIAAFIEVHIKNYFIYLSQAQKWLHALPATFKVAVLTASDAYNWTARTIQKNPSIIFYKKIKPKKSRLIYWGVRNVVRVWMSKFAQRLSWG